MAPDKRMTAQEKSKAEHKAGSLLELASRNRGRLIQEAMTRPATAWLALGIGLMVTVLASIGAWWQIRSRDEARFFTRTEALGNGILRELDRYAGLLDNARALWGVHPFVVHDEWRTYVESLALSNRFPGLLALGYIERVSSARQSVWLEQMRPEPNRPAGRAAVDFQVQPPIPQTEHYLVKFVEPMDSNRPALGYDISGEPHRCLAAQRARDTGEATLTSKIALVQAPQAPGVLFLLPVYSKGMPPADAGQRRASLQGWVYAAFVVQDLWERIRHWGGEEVEVQVFDGPRPDPAARLMQSHAPPGPGGRAPRPAFERSLPLSCGNRVWTVRFRTSPAFVRTPWFSAPGYVSAAGLGMCISLLVFGIARAQASTQRRAQAMAEAMTAKLRLQHHAMACARNGLFILDASRQDCPIIYANPAFEKITGYSTAEPLGDETLFLLRDKASRNRLPGMRAILQGGAADHPVVREYRRDGAGFWAEFRLLPVLDERGEPTHYLGMVEDVTERKRAEQQLARADRRYHELVDNLPVGVYRNTPGDQGKFQEANPALLAMVEAATKEELMAHSASDFYVNPAQRRELSEQLLHQGFVKDVEMEMQTLNHRKFWASITATRKTDAQGNVFFDGVVVDITVRKLAEESVRNSESRLRAILENAADGIITIDEQGIVESFNPAAVGMFGYAAEEIIGQSVNLLMPLPHREEHHRYLARYGAGGPSKVIGIRREEMGRRADGSVFPMDLSVSELQLSGRRIFSGIVRDITTRKQAEQAVKESQERFALAVRGTNDGIWDWNVLTGEIYYSPRWKTMLGYEEHEVENTFAGWERLLHPEDRQRASEAVQAYFSGRTESYELEHRLRHKDGTYRWILARGVALRDPQGNPLRMAGSHVDLTARKQAEDQLRRACQELAQSQATLHNTVKQLQAANEKLRQTQLQLIQAAKMECIGTLAAGVAHEVKNPLQTILVGVDYLDGSLPDRPGNVGLALADMRDAVGRANTIIRDLLQLSAETAFELAHGDLNEVVERSLRLLNSELVSARIKVVCELEAGLPPIGMDAGKMGQVFLNLFINARQAMAHDGTLRVATRSGCSAAELRVEESLAGRFRPGERLVVAEVQDTGSGIAQEHLARIFDPFFTTKPVGMGTGLGLSIVRKIIDLHQGAMEVRNALEGGVVVTLLFRAG